MTYSQLQHMSPDDQLPEVDHREEYESGLEVVDHPNDGLPALPPAPGAQKEYTEPPSAFPQNSFVAKRRWWRRKRVIIGGIIVLLLIIVGAVVGAVLGTRQSSQSASSSTPSPSSPSGSNLSSVVQGSALGVTGWRSSDGSFTIWLMFQDPDGYIRLSRYYSNAGSWTQPGKIIKAKSGTCLGVSSFHVGAFFQTSDTYYQIELFYQNDSDLLLEWNFRDTDFQGAAGSLNSDNIDTGITRMSSYWPSTIFQSSNQSLMEMEYTLGVTWSRRELARPHNFTGVANVPNDPSANKHNLIFQRTDGSVINYFGNDSLTNNSVTGGLYSTDPLNINIPSEASVGAFSVPHTSSSVTPMDVYVLSQKASGDIQVSWQTDGTGWQGPQTYPALAGADKDTNIACLTPSAYPSTNLQAKFDMSRCYFQVGGQIREVMFTGSDWVIVGNIPLS